MDSGLSANTEYEYTIISTDAGDNTSTSETVAIQTFNEYSFPDNLNGFWDFNSYSGIRIYDVSDREEAYFEDGPTWGEGKIDKAVVLNGLNNRILFDNPNDFEYTGENKSFSLWYWADSSDTDMGQILSKPWNGGGGGVEGMMYNYFIKKLESGRIYIYLGGATSWSVTSSTSDTINTDDWNHIVLTLGSDKSVKVYLNGELIISETHTITDWTSTNINQKLTAGCVYPYEGSTIWAGNTTYCVKGKLDNFRFYDDVLTADEIDNLYRIENREENEVIAFWNAIEDGDIFSGAVDLKAEALGEVQSFRFTVDSETIGNLHSSRPFTQSWDSSILDNGFHDLSANITVADGITINGPGTINFMSSNNDGISIELVPAIDDQKITPITTSLTETGLNKLYAISARNEYEPVSFAVHSKDTVLNNINITVSDLENEDGESIDSSNIDIKSVKNWYQSGSNAWNSISQSSTRTPTLVPELLLNDDSLVQVDYENEINYVKMNDESLVNVSTTDDSELRYYTLAEFPVQDADTFQPIESLSTNEWKQFWLTVHVPDDILGGTYTGTVTLTSDDCDDKTIDFEVYVPGFDLEESNIEHTLYYTGRINPSSAQIGHSYKTVEQYTNEMIDMREHGVTNPTMYQAPSSDYFEQELEIRENLGMNDAPLYSLGLGVTVAISTATMDQYIPQMLQWVSEYGFTELYLYGQDEASGEDLTAQRSDWEYAHNLGAKIFVAGYDDAFAYVGDLLDLLIHSKRPQVDYAAQWHGENNKIYSYGDPQIGVEDPFVYRRNYGLVRWAANYDGVMDFAYQYAFGRPWNDFDNGTYRDHNFTYPALNGPIGTIAWEGYREAYDDNRYIATLEAAISYGQNSSNSEKVLAATTAQTYLTNLKAATLTNIGTGSYTEDYEVDLDVIKSEIVNHIENIYEDVTAPQSFELLLPSNNQKYSHKSRFSLSWENSIDTENQDIKSGISHYQIYIDNVLYLDQLKTTSSTIFGQTSGNHDLFVRVFDKNGNYKDSNILTFEIAQIEDIVNLNRSEFNEIVLSGKTRFFSNKDNTKLQGEDSTIAGGYVKIYKNGKKYATTEVDDNGFWDKKISFSNNHNYTIKLKFYDRYDTLRDTKQYTLKLDNQDPIIKDLKLENNQLTFQANDEDTDIDYYKIKLLDKQGKIIRKWKKIKPNKTYSIPEKIQNQVETIVIRVYDKAGNKVERSIAYKQSSTINPEKETQTLGESNQNNDSNQTPLEEIKEENQETVQNTSEVDSAKATSNRSRRWWNPFSWF